MNRLLLFLVMLPKGLWKSLGADTVQLKAILQAKLTVDDRKPFSMGANKAIQRKKKKPNKNTSLLTAFISLLMGMIYVFPIVMTRVDPVVGLAIFYTMFIFFLTFMLITDFAKVLVDTQDKLILFPRPVSDKTLMMSRVLYIIIYLLRVVIPMSLPAWILFSVFKGWVGALWFPIPVIFTVLIVIFLINALYMLMLKLSKPGKFKETINYFQIAFSIVFFATYMLGTKMIDYSALDNGIDIKTYDWARYFPTYWMAASWSWVDSTAKLLPGTKLLSILAIVFPFICFWATFKWLAPNFSKQLVASEDSVDAVDDKPKKKNVTSSTKSNKEPLYKKLSNIVNRDSATKAGFLITWMMTGRSRSFRMRVYPMFAYVPVYFFYLIWTANEPFTAVWNGLPTSKKYIGLLYICSFVIMQTTGFISMSDKYKAAWVYYASPLDKPGKVIVGAFKAMWLKYYAPYMVLIGCFVVYIWGPLAILDVILATINSTAFVLAITLVGNRVLPFSMKEQIKDSATKSVGRVLLTFLIVGVFGVTHYLLPGVNASSSNTGVFASLSTILPWLAWGLKLIFIILSSSLLWLLFDSLKNTSWEKLKNNDEHM